MRSLKVCGGSAEAGSREVGTRVRLLQGLRRQPGNMIVEVFRCGNMHQPQLSDSLLIIHTRTETIRRTQHFIVKDFNILNVFYFHR